MMSYDGFASLRRKPITAARKNSLAWSTAIEGIVHEISLSFELELNDLKY